MARQKNRKHSIIDQLAPDLKSDVENMLLTGRTYADIVDYLQSKSVSISPASICRYARSFQASLEMLKIAKENFNRAAEVVAQFPKSNIKDVLIGSYGMLLWNARQNMSEDDLAKMNPVDVLREVNSFIRNATNAEYTDVKIRRSVDLALDEIQNDFYNSLALKHPELYAQLGQVIEQEKQALDQKAGG